MGRRKGCTIASRWISAMALTGLLGPASADDVVPRAPVSVTELMTRDVGGMADKEAVMMTVSYLPGGASLPHRHDAQVFVYVLEGTMRMQLEGGPLLSVGQGQTFYEGPDDLHRVSSNASQTAPARLLVLMIKGKAKQASRSVSRRGAP